MGLRKCVNCKVNPIQIAKDIFSKIKTSDPAALLIPIENQGREATYINKPVYIPIQKEDLLEYVSHGFVENTWMRHIAIRLHYSLWTLKEQVRFRGFLSKIKKYIYL